MMTKRNGVNASWATKWFQFALSAMSVFFVAVDVVMNNWEIINYIGNANYLLTPLLNTGTPDQLARSFSFSTRANLESLSQVGRFMVSFVLNSSYTRDPTEYILTAGAHRIHTDTNNVCGALVESYPLPSRNSTSMKLAVVHNRMQLIRGNTLDNFFRAPNAPPPPPHANYTTLAYLGYIPARMDVDMRLTTPVRIPPVGESVVANISMYRFASRSFCSGCDPIVELGLDTCNAMYHVDEASQALVVTSSAAYRGEYHYLGVILSRSAGTAASLYLRGVALVIAVVGFTTSKKTTRWTVAASMGTTWKRIAHTLAPPLYRYNSHTFTFSNFCLNSDYFVVAYVVAVVLDEKNSMVYSRIMYDWNGEGQNPWMQVQIMAIQFRWLWINCLLVKAAKVFVNFVSMARYTGSNAVVGFLNFSSVTYIYLGTIFLMQRTPYIEYGNTDRAALESTAANLDGIRIDVFNSWYIRSFPSMMVVMVVNLMGMLALDRVLNRHKWRRLARNSLGRQAMFNSSSILCEMCYAFQDVAGYENQAVIIQTRALCTVQWFLMCHTLCFGLPESPMRVRAMLTSDGGGRGKRSNLATTIKVATHRAFAAGQAIAFKSKGSSYGVEDRSIQPTESDSGGTSTTRAMRDLCMVAQDGDGIIHLYDARKLEVNAMAFEVKILSDSRFTIA